MLVQQGVKQKELRDHLGRESLTPSAFVDQQRIDVARAFGPRPGFGDLVGDALKRALEGAAGIAGRLGRRRHPSGLRARATQR